MKTFFESIDIFDKSSNDEFHLETKTSTMLTYFLSFACFLLISSQIISFFKPELVRDLNLHATTLDEQELVNVSINIMVNMPCYFLHLDVVDNLGSEQLDINTTAKFYRLNKNYATIGLSNASISDDCHPCFGLQPEGVCCNSCEHIKYLLMMNNITKKHEELPQCIGKPPVRVYANEKCKIKGKVSLNKAQGNFHIAPGANIRKMDGHMHNLNADFKNLDLSHSILNLRVGPKIPLTYNPLSGHREFQDPNVAIVYKYNLIVTPAVYKVKGKVIGRGYDYTVIVSRWWALNGGSAPGIYFHYSFTPYGVTVTANYLSLGQIISSTSGFLAGIYAVLSLFDETFFKQLSKELVKEHKVGEKKEAAKEK